LRTPLNAIIGYSEMIQEEVSDGEAINPAQLKEDLEKIVFSGRQLLSLINDVLDLSKIETGKMTLHKEWFNPRLAIERLSNSMSPLLAAQHNTLILVPGEALPDIYTDATKFRQIFTNLLGNANKFTEQGEIKVEMKLGDGDQLVITVEDTGIGMTAEQLDRIFEVFEQADHSTSAKYGGTGLGLSLCREFATLLGGGITAASMPNEGSRFTVTLPLHRA